MAYQYIAVSEVKPALQKLNAGQDIIHMIGMYSLLATVGQI